jgi:hypothetical protein
MKKTLSSTLLSLFHAHKTMKETLKKKKKKVKGVLPLICIIKKWQSSVMSPLNIAPVCVILLQLGYIFPRSHTISMSYTPLTGYFSSPYGECFKCLMHCHTVSLVLLSLCYQVIIVSCYMFKGS